MREMGDQLAVTCYTQLAPQFCHLIGLFCIFLIFGPIFAQLFEGLFELFFFSQTLYAWKFLDIQFSMFLTSPDLELWSSRYHSWKEGDAVLKNSVMFFLKKFVSFNSRQTSSSPFYEKQIRPFCSRWSSRLTLILAQSVQLIVQSRAKNCLFSYIKNKKMNKKNSEGLLGFLVFW